MNRHCFEVFGICALIINNRARQIQTFQNDFKQKAFFRENDTSCNFFTNVTIHNDKNF